MIKTILVMSFELLALVQLSTADNTAMVAIDHSILLALRKVAAFHFTFHLDPHVALNFSLWN